MHVSINLAHIGRQFSERGPVALHSVPPSTDYVKLEPSVIFSCVAVQYLCGLNLSTVKLLIFPRNTSVSLFFEEFYLQ
jgi:hypothetical protein